MRSRTAAASSNIAIFLLPVSESGRLRCYCRDRIERRHEASEAVFENQPVDRQNQDHGTAPPNRLFGRSDRSVGGRQANQGAWIRAILQAGQGLIRWRHSSARVSNLAPVEATGTITDRRPTNNDG